MLKCCVQVGTRPDISNTVNMVPVDHVARLVTAAAFNPPKTAPGVCHVTSHPRMTFNEYLSTLEAYGYKTPLVSYDEWRSTLERYVEDDGSSDREELALLGLYHMVTDDLPNSTKAPELDDRNATQALKADVARSGQDHSGGSAVTQDVVGLYLAFLVARGFMPAPSQQGKLTLPEVRLGDEQLAAMKGSGGRGGTA